MVRIWGPCIWAPDSNSQVKDVYSLDNAEWGLLLDLPDGLSRGFLMFVSIAR